MRDFGEFWGERFGEGRKVERVRFGERFGEGLGRVTGFSWGIGTGIADSGHEREREGVT